MFIPTTQNEIESLGWDKPDIILITGDAYIDSPHIGVAVIGKYLIKNGFKTAIIAQPLLSSNKDIARLGEPKLFWGVTAGCIDSMVANFTPTKKFRNQDDYTPGGINLRPNRAAMAYTNLIRQYFKNTKPVVLGGLEASLRRIAHYDYWDNAVRRSILFDSKADILAYGMAEKTIVELASSFKNGTDWKNIKGICYISPDNIENFISLPSFEDAAKDKKAFFTLSELFHKNLENLSAGFTQKHGERFLVHNPPQHPLTEKEIDGVYDMEFERDAHPYYKTGEIRALETIKQSITTHRGCFGLCNFCAIAVHQGSRIISRSAQSIINEVNRIKKLPGFNGIIYDVGGATANMYGTTCVKEWKCSNRHCLMPQPCNNLKFGHKTQIKLLQTILNIPGIKKVFISSGIRYDMVIADKDCGRSYVEQLVSHHVSGQIKLAPEHYDNEVLTLMNKPSIKSLMKFKELFENICKEKDKRFFMTYYLMAAHPGCTNTHMQRLKSFLQGGLKILPEQIQIFTPTPSTNSTTMYYCETDMAGKKIFCEKDQNAKQKQKDILRKNNFKPKFWKR